MRSSCPNASGSGCPGRLLRRKSNVDPMAVSNVEAAEVRRFRITGCSKDD